VIENKSEAEASEKLILWRGFFEKHPEELVKEVKYEKDFIREHPGYQPCLQAWFDSESGIKARLFGRLNSQ
jgi:hypothetical protein